MSGKRVVESEVRVRYAETDAQGVVYYANYFVWFEVGRINFLREVGFDYHQMERDGLGFFIAEATCRYHSPARFDDLLLVRTWIEEVRRRSFSFGYEIVRKGTGELLATGRTVQVFIDMRTRRPTEIPPPVRTTLLNLVGDEGTPESSSSRSGGKATSHS